MVQGCLVRLSSHRGGRFFCELWLEDFFFHACTVVQDEKQSLEQAQHRDYKLLCCLFSSLPFPRCRPLPHRHYLYLLRSLPPHFLLFRRIPQSCPGTCLLTSRGQPCLLGQCSHRFFLSGAAKNNNSSFNFSCLSQEVSLTCVSWQLVS